MAPVTPAPRNVHANFVFFCVLLFWR